MLATLLDPHSSEFRITHVEMIKGISGQGFYSNMVVPIIENTARECELTDRLREAIVKYPQANAVLVRRHGVYVWGDTWIHAKTQFECYEYLFEAAVRMHALGIDAKAAPAPAPIAPSNGNGNGTHAAANSNGNNTAAALSADARPVKRPRSAGSIPSHIVLDIEGTVAPISFVADILFPYAQARLKSHLEENFDSAETQSDLDLLRQQALADGTPFPDAASASKEEIINAAVECCEAQMAADRKTTALKALQGHIWREGFASGHLRAELFRDVPDALATWRSQGIKTYIYSSGSRQAQRDLFAHTQVGDLRPYLSGFFDTTSGVKVEAQSYANIALSLGADAPSDILFATDNVLEAQAAGQAGWRAVVVDRPGNKPLPENYSEFKVVNTMEDLF
jgi:methylthioribulose 1-phosphate dehydratase/enolase-phosphatase E1